MDVSLWFKRTSQHLSSVETRELSCILFALHFAALKRHWVRPLAFVDPFSTLFRWSRCVGHDPTYYHNPLSLIYPITKSVATRQTWPAWIWRQGAWSKTCSAIRRIFPTQAGMHDMVLFPRPRCQWKLNLIFQTQGNLSCMQVISSFLEKEKGKRRKRKDYFNINMKSRCEYEAILACFWLQNKLLVISAASCFHTAYYFPPASPSPAKSAKSPTSESAESRSLV